MGLSHSLANFIETTSFEVLPQDVVEFTKLCILDWYGSALAGKDKPAIKKIAEMVEEMGGNPQATLVTGGTSSVAQAALVNGASSHIVELDDIHKGSIIHAATVVIPAALATAEWKNCTGKELITAVAIGYEVCYRIGEAVSPSHYYYWHNTATCGTFGAAAATAKLMQLSNEQIVHTLGSAGTQAAGLWEFIEDGAMSKQLHPGKASYNGVISSLLGEKDFTAAKRILEGDRGFFKAMSDEYDESKITDELGKTFKITENSFKVHASCRHTHAVIDLILDIVKEHKTNDKTLEKINIQTYQTALTITDNPNPNTVYASKFSLQFCAALAYTRCQATLADFNEDSLYDDEIRSVMEQVEVSVSPTIESAYPEKWGAEVEVSFTNGNHYTKQSDYPKGDPENAVSSVELQDKFRALTRDHLGGNLEKVVGDILDLENKEGVIFLRT
jgi:2-methylcitrate dehydratase PrpD